MFPDHSDVQNLKQLILLSQDNRTACQILLDLLNPHILELEKGFHYPQYLGKSNILFALITLMMALYSNTF